MIDPIFRDWMQSQVELATELAANSDVVALTPSPLPWHQYDGIPCIFTARFTCRGMIRVDERNYSDEEQPFDVGIIVQPDHLRRLNPFELVTWLAPHNVWHPNINVQRSAICIGKVPPGYELTDLLHQLYEIITYQNHAEHDLLNEEAAEWARRNAHRFPLEQRPLRRFAGK